MSSKPPAPPAPPERKRKSSPDKKPHNKKKKSPLKKSKASLLAESAVDVVIPPSLYSSQNNSGECTVLVQVDPQDATVLDFEGVTGAIGRMEADEERITFDLKGYQYAGTIHPGPTAMVLALHKDPQDKGKHFLKVDAVTDEFVTLKQTTDIMAKLDPSVLQGTMDEGYNVVDDDVNAKSALEEENESATKQKSNKTETSGKKKKVQKKSSAASGKVSIKVKN